MKTCFVIQPFDADLYDRLFDEVFSPAIARATLKAYRVDRDPASVIPIERIEQGIKNSAACFAEISTDNPNVWFELGFAIATQKPVCIVCSSERTRFPFDVQHRKILTYKRAASPSDFEKLGARITANLEAILAAEDNLESNAEAVASLSTMPETQGLRPHELLGLTIIFQYQFMQGLSVYQFQKEIQKGGFVLAGASLAIMGLKHKGLIRFEPQRDVNGEVYDAMFVSDKGEQWLLANQDKLNLRLPEQSDEPPF